MTKNNSTQIHSELPLTGFVRIPQILKVIPISESGWWRWVASGKAPLGIKLGPKTTAWRAEDITALIDSLGQDGIEGD